MLPTGICIWAAHALLRFGHLLLHLGIGWRWGLSMMLHLADAIADHLARHEGVTSATGP